MKIQSTSFDNVYLIHEDVHSDDRGIFMETYNELNYTKKSLLFDIESEMAMKDDGTIYTTYFVQDNLSVSKKNVFRGLHYQTGDYGQTKLVRVLKGSVVDFIVDLREKSDTYGKFEYFELSERNKLSLFIPPYFAHGFLSLQDDTIFHYKCGNLYKKENEGSVTPFDDIIRHVSDNKSTIKDIVDMYLVDVEPLLSEKDSDSPKFMDRRIN